MPFFRHERIQFFACPLVQDYCRFKNTLRKSIEQPFLFTEKIGDACQPFRKRLRIFIRVNRNIGSDDYI